VGGLDVVGGGVERPAGRADRLVVDDPVAGARDGGHYGTALAGGDARMSRARSTASAAWTVIHSSAHILWHDTPWTGDRHTVSPPHSTHGAGGPVAACRQSRTTPPAGALVA